MRLALGSSLAPAFASSAGPFLVNEISELSFCPIEWFFVESLLLVLEHVCVEVGLYFTVYGFDLYVKEAHDKVV